MIFINSIKAKWPKNSFVYPGMRMTGEWREILKEDKNGRH